MAYTTIDDPTQYFETLIWTGDGNTPRSLSGLEFQPDMVWSKRRDDAAGHNVLDSVRGAGVDAELCPSTAGIEGSNNQNAYGYLSAFTSDGFTVTEGSSDNAYWNNNTATYVAWCWKETATAGFDIVGYTGNATDDVDISHSLSAVPHAIILKNRDNTNGENWNVYHHKNTSAPETDYLHLNLTNATNDNEEWWSDEAPTSSVFTIGRQDTVNTSSGNHIAYLWSEKQGYSKFGGYTGNGDSGTDGAFIYLGFRPAMVLVKRTNGTKDWKIFDNKRNGYNGSNEVLEPNDSGAEDTTEFLDFLSNGFKWRIPSSDAKYADVNGDGDTFIYMAFAEAPFVNSNGVPCNAR